jgi:hypothetical protein
MACFGFMKLTGISKVFMKLPIALIPQHASNWCWAATTEMASRFFHSRNPNAPILEQSSLAIANFGSRIPKDSLRYYLAPKVNKILNQPGYPFSPANGYSTGFNGFGGAYAWPDLIKKLSDTNAVIFQWNWVGVTDSTKIRTGSHFLLATGYVSSPADSTYQWVMVNDPWPVDTGRHRVISYDEYANNVTFKLPEYKGKEFRSHGTDYFATFPKK